MSWLSRLATRPRQVVIRRPPAIKESPLPSIVERDVDYTGTDILNYARQEYKLSLNQDNRWQLFDRISPEYSPVGSILTITYKELLTGNETKFTGFLLALRRHAATPTIILRAIHDGIGVEQVFSVFSPSIKKIECDKRATCLYGNKAYWIRENPKWMSRFFAPPDQKVSIKEIRAANRLKAAAMNDETGETEEKRKKRKKLGRK